MSKCDKHKNCDNLPDIKHSRISYPRSWYKDNYQTFLSECEEIGVNVSFWYSGDPQILFLLHWADVDIKALATKYGITYIETNDHISTSNTKLRRDGRIHHVYN